jgi:hypothetical protein
MARIRPETAFETTLSSGITAAANTIALTTAPTETTGYMVIEPGTSNKEIIKYTGVSSTTLTGVSRGLSLTGSSDAAGTGLSHAAGSIVSMTNVHYFMEQLTNATEANTWTAEQTFETANINIGDGSTDENEQITANNGDANTPFLRYSSADNEWHFSDNGVDTVAMNAAGGSLTAGDGIAINASAIDVDLATDSGTAFESDKLKVVGQQDIQVAGATISGATLPVPCYKSSADDEWYACDANDTSAQEFGGFAVSDGTDGAAITIQFNGVVSGFTGLTEGATYYVTNTVGTISTTVGTNEIVVGIAISATEIFIQQKDLVRTGGITNWSKSVGTSNSGTESETITLGFRPRVVWITGFATNGSDTPVPVRGMVQYIITGSTDTIGTSVVEKSNALGFFALNATIRSTFTGGNTTIQIGNITDTGFDVQHSWSSGGTYAGTGMAHTEQRYVAYG